MSSFLSVKTAILVANATTSSRLDYCNSLTIWGSTKPVLLNVRSKQTILGVAIWESYFGFVSPDTKWYQFQNVWKTYRNISHVKLKHTQQGGSFLNVHYLLMRTILQSNKDKITKQSSRSSVAKLVAGLASHHRLSPLCVGSTPTSGKCWGSVPIWPWLLNRT